MPPEISTSLSIEASSAAKQLPMVAIRLEGWTIAVWGALMTGARSAQAWTLSSSQDPSRLRRTGIRAG
jgi:hypothetical protein